MVSFQGLRVFLISNTWLSNHPASAPRHMPVMHAAGGPPEHTKRVECIAAQVLADAKRNRSEVLAEAVPEALKNALLVMAAQGLLAPAWTVRRNAAHAAHVHGARKPA